MALSVVCSRDGLVLSRPEAPMVAKTDPTHISVSRAVDMSVVQVPHALWPFNYKMGQLGHRFALDCD